MAFVGTSRVKSFSILLLLLILFRYERGFYSGLDSYNVGNSHAINEHHDNGATNITVHEETGPISSATGSLFSGSAFRSFTGNRYFHDGWREKATSLFVPKENANKHKKWAVVTTISGPTEAVMLVAQLPAWCTVVVADKKTPDNYMDLLSNLTEIHNKCIHFLSISKQEKWAQHAGGEVADFLRAIPYNHFARKNIGFLYAVKHGAAFIYDFDDDNILMRNSNEDTIDPVGNTTHLNRVRVPMVGTTVFNHHKLMNASLALSWPRGFPLEYVLVEETTGVAAFTKEAVSLSKIGVMQYCAQGDPDVDAVHRLVKPLPMTFDVEALPLQVPAHAFSPYNAQATVHTYSALWALLLPCTVPGRVSDIWRGYFASTIFRELDLSLVFLPPKVRQDRNAHSYLADMRAELDLYFKSSRLIEFLSDGWSSSAESIPEMMENLWIQLYERGYIESDDVKLVQLWLKALVDVDYEFPPLKRRRINNLVLMGQFNYNTRADFVIFWVQKWREWFRDVIVHGPFDDSTFHELQTHGIVALQGSDDKGFVSPMDNLKQTLLQFKHNKRTDGVLYVHDDALLNISAWIRVHEESPESIIGSQLNIFPNSYKDHRFIKDAESMSGTSYKLLVDGSFQKSDGRIFSSNETRRLASTLMHWTSRKCLPVMANIAQSNAFEVYKDFDGSFIVPSPTQADVLLVPMILADAYSRAAQIMIDSKMFLECGFPIIVQMLQNSLNATATALPLCTDWRKLRGTEGMIIKCLKSPTSFVVFHPYKLSRGLKEWNKAFDMVSLDGLSET